MDDLPPSLFQGCDSTDTVVTDVSVSFSESTDAPSTGAPDSQRWHRVEKDLYLHTAHQTAWLQVAQAEEKDLAANDLVVTDIRIGRPHHTAGMDDGWENRPGGIWILKSSFAGASKGVVTEVDVLFGADAVDPRPHWSLMKSPLKLNAPPDVPIARLSVRHGKTSKSPDDCSIKLSVRGDGTFKIVQISDTHLVTGVGVCKDAADANGQPLPDSEADPLTIRFIEGILDIEEPDLVILTGDQVHHDIPDSQSALFKIVAPLIERSIPFAAVFGNHDDEGQYALSRMAQMRLLQDLPFSLSQPGPAPLDGVGNYFLQIFGQAPSHQPLSTLYLFDSHGQIPSEVNGPDYDWIRQSQIDWFESTSQALRKEREESDSYNCSHLPLAFWHIPFPEFAASNLIIRGGQRREPTEGPSFNSHFYDALVKEGVVAVGCGHDHVNDFCGLLPESQQNGNTAPQLGPWLCYGGTSGFGGYCSYDKNRYHRRLRVWELDTGAGRVKTWKRVEYAKQRIDELVLVEDGAVVAPPPDINGGESELSRQLPL